MWFFELLNVPHQVYTTELKAAFAIHLTMTLWTSQEKPEVHYFLKKHTNTLLVYPGCLNYICTYCTICIIGLGAAVWSSGTDTSD